MGLFDTLFGRRQASRSSQPASASVAKQRLVEVLIQDHVKLTPAAMEAIRQDIVKIL